jgi:hypothetical protein
LTQRQLSSIPTIGHLSDVSTYDPVYTVSYLDGLTLSNAHTNLPANLQCLI